MMLNLILWPFRFAWSVLTLVFEFVFGLVGTVFGLVGGILGFLFSAGVLVLVIIGIVAIVRWFIRGVRGV